MRGRPAWVMGGFALVGAAALAARKVFRGFRASADGGATDTRAEDLRRKLDESRSMLAEREEFESAETPVDRAEAAAGSRAWPRGSRPDARARGGLTVGWRFQRRKRLLPGVTLNLGKGGGSFSLGRRGARVNVGRRGASASASLLGTGLSYVWRLGRRRR
jgi:hypothetical protein